MRWLNAAIVFYWLASVVIPVSSNTVNFLTVQTPQNFAVITLKFEQDGFTKK